MADTGDRTYRAELGQVLRRRDPNALHLFLRRSAATHGDESQIRDVEQRSHDEMLELMHRMILTRPDLADLHAESRTWLATRGVEQPPAARSSGQRGRPSSRPGRDARRPGRPGSGWGA